MGCNCNKSDSLADVLHIPVRPKQNYKPLGMIEYLLSKGWKHTGNCGACNGGYFYTNTSHEGWRLKIMGNTSGFIQQNQNPLNKQDYKNLDVFNNVNYIEKLNQFFQ